ncbi:MAG TPA: hypothetical protein VH413_18890 [Verrucomicrobiae bacterium]|jgi:hypothetical protein|nr:hypothetical protein [Verrucomicrobiae bacterium]
MNVPQPTDLITPERIQLSIRARFNPIPSLTPQLLSAYLESFRVGFFRNIALTWDAIERRDYKIQAVAPKRKKSVARNGWEILTLDNSPAAQQQKAALEYFYNHLTATTALEENETGGLTPTSANVETAPYLPFPYTGLTPSVEGSVWQVSEDHYIHTVTDPNFGIVVTVDVQLSNQYTLTMLESDTDDLLATIDVSQVNWFTLVSTQNGALDDPTRLLPPQYTYGPSQFPGPVSIPQLGAAAWSVLVPEPVGNTTWIPNVYAKAVGYFAMAGNYCEKTFLLDYNGAPLSNSCSSGVGTCAGEFMVQPPPLTDSENAYVLIVPNCVCG